MGMLINAQAGIQMDRYTMLNKTLETTLKFLMIIW